MVKVLWKLPKMKYFVLKKWFTIDGRERHTDQSTKATEQQCASVDCCLIINEIVWSENQVSRRKVLYLKNIFNHNKN
jgi:hypothetical protein